MGEKGKGGGERWKREKAKEERTASFNISYPYPVTVFNRKSTLLVTRCAISCPLHRSSIFFPPSPGCRMQLSMLYIRGTSIFSTYGHVVRTYIHTYLFFVDTRRHCCELNATRYRASSWRCLDTIYTQISTHLSPSTDVSIFRNFFFFFL